MLNGGHTGPVQCLQFNPCYMMMASACSHLNMWLPNLTDAEREEATREQQEAVHAHSDNSSMSSSQRSNGDGV